MPKAEDAQPPSDGAKVDNPEVVCNPHCGQAVDNALPPDLPTAALAAIADARRAAIEAAPEAAEKDAIEARLDAAHRRRCAALLETLGRVDNYASASQTAAMRIMAA